MGPSSQVALLKDLLVTLDMIADNEVGPAFEGDTTLGVLAHLGNVLLDILQRGHGAWKIMSAMLLDNSHVCVFVPS